MKSPQIITMTTIPALVALSLAAAPTYAGTHHHHSSRGTSYALSGSGYGTRVIGGQIPVGSATSGYKPLGCTNRAGRQVRNDVAAATLPGLGKAMGVKSRLWTTAHKGVVAIHSTHTVARLSLVQSSLGSLSVDAVRTQVKAYHDASGFHATTATELGDLTFTPPVGPAQKFPLPTPNQPITIPGLATIYAGQHTTHKNANGAVADAYALRVDVIPTGTSVRVAHSRAQIAAGMTSGIFRGHSAATRVVTALGDIVKSGPQPLSPMPCQGTYGKLHVKSLASVDLGGQLIVKGAVSRERGNQGAKRAWGTSRAEVARVNLGDQLVVDGVVGKVTVSRKGHHLKRSTAGTELGTVTVGGQVQTFPKTGVLEIPGVARLERGVVKKSHNGASVIGLRITLLDGSGAVVNLAEASLRIGHLAR